MARFILIETSTNLCSTALAENGKIISYKEHFKEHAAQTAPMIKDMLDEHNLRVQDCDAVAVSMGPGSYTGLRIGVSHAKALCFGANIPLIAISSLECLFYQAKNDGLISNNQLIVPMIDARRMEVYQSIYTKDGELIEDIAAKIIDENSYSELLKDNNMIFIGDAADKCSKVITSSNAHFIQSDCKAKYLLEPCLKAYKEKQFKDIAYFEPFYLKEFVATESRKKLF